MVRGSSTKRAGWGRFALAATLAGACLLGPAAAAAQEREEGARLPAPTASGSGGEDATGASEDAPKVGLDDLLRLPSGYGADVESKGGATAPEWRERFSAARQDLADAKKKLEKVTAELDQMSGDSSSWSVAAPGSSDPQSSPLSLRLRQDMKAERARIAEAERELRGLHVEADLAGVPPDWRE